MKSWAGTSRGLFFNALAAKVSACGGLSSTTARAMPSSAGPSFSSTFSAASNERTASGRLYFSRNSSPQPVLTSTSAGASVLASRKKPLASSKRPSARAARPARRNSRAVSASCAASSINCSERRASVRRPSWDCSSPSSSAASPPGVLRGKGLKDGFGAGVIADRRRAPGAEDGRGARRRSAPARGDRPPRTGPRARPCQPRRGRRRAPPVCSRAKTRPRLAVRAIETRQIPQKRRVMAPGRVYLTYRPRTSLSS